MESKSDTGGLARRTIGALKWSYIGVAARVVLQVVAQIALARLLGPEAFGVVTAAVLVILIAGIVAELGMSVALIQAATIDELDVRYAFTRVLGATIVVAAVVFASADLVAALFENPRIAPVLQWMTLALAFQTLGAVSLGLLKRKLDFKSIQVAQLLSYLFGYFVVGVGCAWFGAGEWSLVAAWVAQTFIASAIQFARAPHSLALTLRPSNAPLIGYGLRTVFASLANWLIENIDNVMVGRAFGTTTLGAYAIAYNLVRTPVNHIVFSLQQVLQPFIARTQDDSAVMRKAYHSSVWMVALVTMPAFFGLGALAPTVVDALYGAAWVEAAPILLPLALAMPLQALQAVGGPVLWGSGQVSREIRISLWMVALLIALLGVASTISPVAMAWGVFAAYLTRSIWVTASVSQIVGASLRKSLSMLVGGLIVGTLTAAALYLVNELLIGSGTGPIVRLATAMLFGALLLPALIVLLAKAVIPEDLHDVLGYLLQRLPAAARIWFVARMTGNAPIRNPSSRHP
jgi:lipopolysaccharide exporter